MSWRGIRSLVLMVVTLHFVEWAPLEPVVHLGANVVVVTLTLVLAKLCGDL